MPKMTNEEVKGIPGTSFQYSMVKPENLGATEYTLVTVVIDVTGSVQGFEGDLLKMLKEVVKACHKNPRSENLLLRVLSFNTRINEIHGFRELNNINADDYQDFRPDGMTALFDATMSALGATIDYSKQLMDQDFNVNGAIYIITDGADNSSTYSAKNISELISKSKKSEIIESLITILIGINTADCGSYLSDFQAKAGLTQYIDMGSVHPGKLAKLAGWISKSISSSSQALGTGGPSQPTSLTF
jgi:uncharacterized protein YegL